MSEQEAPNPFETLKCINGETAARAASKEITDKKCLKCPSGQYDGVTKGTCQYFWKLKLANGKNVYGVKISK